MAVLLDVSPPRRPPRGLGPSRSRSTTAGAPRPAGHAARGHRRHPPAGRLQPQQPDQHGPAAGRDAAAFIDQVPAHVCVILDEAYCEFDLLDDTGRLDRPAGQLPEPGPVADLLQGPWALRPACGFRPVRLGGSAAGRSIRSASRSSATRWRRPRRSSALAHQDEVLDRVSPNRGRADLGRAERLRALGIAPADSQANFCWVAPRGRPRRGSGSWRGCATGVSSSGRDRAAARTSRLSVSPIGLPEETRRLPGCARGVALAACRRRRFTWRRLSAAQSSQTSR